nr:type II secretion system secretin GspD [Pseudomonas sp. PIA16]
MPRGYLLALLMFVGLASADDRRWQLSMKDAELRDVVHEVSAILGVTVVLDPRVKGRITVMSEQQLDREGVRQLFHSVLEANGFAAIDEGDRLLVIPAGEAKGWGGVQPASAHFTTRVIPLHTAVAADIASLLRPLVSANGYIGSLPSANALVMTDSASNVRRLEALVRQLDSGANLSHEVLELRHGLASEVAKLLEPSPGKAVGEGMGQVIADTRGNRLLVIGSDQARRRLVGLARSLDTPANDKADNSLVLRLRHGDAGQLAEVLDSVAQRMGQVANPGVGKAPLAAASEVLVRADESQNALVLIAEPAQLRTLARIVQQLDQPRAQVLIQAAIVEVSGDVSEALGVQWGLNRGDVSGGINFPGAGISPGNLFGKGELIWPQGAVLGVGSDRFGVLVSALASNSHSNLLSTPSLLTLDNQQAEILVGQNVPFQTGSYTTSSSGADNPFTTVERKDVGISLKIRPHINQGATLRLEVEQESSEIAPGSTASDLITNKRALKSTILADDGEIIVIGGLMKDSVRQQETGVPLLRHIPWAGRLFSWNRDEQVKTNLMVFLRPTIVRGKQDIGRFSEGSYQQLRGSQRGNDPVLLPNELKDVFGQGQAQ